MEKTIPRSEALRRELALQELENAMRIKDVKYVKTLVPFLRPECKEYDSNSSIIDEIESQTSFETEEFKEPAWKSCFCCCNR